MIKPNILNSLRKFAAPLKTLSTVDYLCKCKDKNSNIER